MNLPGIFKRQILVARVYGIPVRIDYRWFIVFAMSVALMGRTEGIEIEEIVLHPFGGLARLKTQPENPKAEFRIAVAGPAASFLFSLIAFGGMILTSTLHFDFGTAFFFFIGAGNLLLAVFNLF